MAAGDVEISTLVPAGEWTQESLAELVKSYERKIAEMGAQPGEIKSHVEHTSRGGVKIRVVWEKGGAPLPPQAAQGPHAPAAADAGASGAPAASAAASGGPAASGGVDAQHGQEPAAG